MKSLKLLLLCSVFFLSCTHKKKDATILNKKHKIVSLIKKASQKNIDINERVYFAKLAFNIIETGENDSIKTSNYIGLANIFHDLGDEKKYIHILNKLYVKATLNKDYDAVSKSAYYIANYYYCNTKYDSAYFYFTKSEKASLKINEKESLAFVKNIKANILTFKKDYVGAEKLSIEALKIAKQEKFELLIYNCYITLGNSLSGLNNDNKAIGYYRKAIKKTDVLINEYQYFNLKAQPYNYIANIYQKRADYQNAITISRQALQFDNFKKNNIAMYCYLMNDLTYSKFKLGDNFILKQFKEILKIGDSIKSIPIQITSNTHLGEYYLAKNDTLSANNYFNVAQKLAHQNQIFEDELKILRFLALANPKKNTYYSNRFIQLNDSLQSVERATRDKFARIEFETDEVTSNNKVIQAENNKLSRRILFIASFSLLFLLVIFLWIRMNVQKNKTRELLLKQEQQKANEVIYQLMLDQQQKIEEGKNIEKLRISQELHDGVMGKLSSIRLNLYVLNKKTDEETIKKCLEYIKEIQSIEKEIRTIAHDLNRNLFSSDVDFIAIVENIFTAIKNHSNIDFDLKTGDNIDWTTVSTAIKINIYRIIQEALQNIDKYAAANNVAISMNKLESNIIITIADDGVGFNTKNSKNGIGLQNMQKRTEECNGTFHIVSTLKIGTKISLAIPI